MDRYKQQEEADKKTADEAKAKKDKVTQLKTDAEAFKEKAKEAVTTANEFKTQANSFANAFSSDGHAKFRDAAQAYGEGAECAGSTESAAYKLKSFAQALVAAAEKFKQFGESLVTASDGSCDIFRKNAQEFAGAVSTFTSTAKEFSDAADGKSGFLNKAQLFKQAAEAIQDITTEVTTKNETVLKPSKVQDAIKIFKLAASVFGGADGAAAKFVAFAQALAKATPGQGPNCYKLFGKIEGLSNKAKAFKSAAASFARQAGYFSQAVTGSNKVGNFKQMAAKFREAADKLKDLAEATAAAYADTNKVNEKAFRVKVVQFHRYATEFEVAAKLVDQVKDQNDLDKVKESFKNAEGKFAYYFGNESEGAAAKLYDAFRAFTSELTKNTTCTQLTGAAGAFKLVVDKQQDSTGFKQLAGDFQKAADGIPTDKLINNQAAQAAIQQFKAAAEKFGNKGGDDTVAGKLSAFAGALHAKVTSGQGTRPDCYKLLMHADKFQKASDNFTAYAQLFQAAAAAFKAKAQAFKEASTHPFRFRDAATSFYESVTYLKALAENLAIDLSGTPLSKDANDFRSQVLVFYNEVVKFYALAQQVTKSAWLDSIKGQFKIAADKFNDAAEQFDGEGQDKVAGAFTAFAQESERVASQSCQRLKEKAGEFTSAAGKFQEKAQQFKTQAEAIEDITVTVISSVTLNGQPVSGDTKEIKPSRVQSAISQFKLSAAKFANAVTIFNKAAETFGKQDHSAATKLETFATGLGGDCKQIKTNAEAFKTKAELFHNQAAQFQCAVNSFAAEAQKFHDLAQQIEPEDQADLDKIKDAFKTAAEKFGKVDTGEEADPPEQDGAAKKLYDAVCKLVT